MTTYIVTFEVNDITRKSKVYEKLKEFRYYCPIHENAWAIQTDKKSTDIRNSISMVMTGNDRIFVIRTGTEAAWLNAYSNEHTEWLKKYL